MYKVLCCDFGNNIISAICEQKLTTVNNPKERLEVFNQLFFLIRVIAYPGNKGNNYSPLPHFVKGDNTFYYQIENIGMLDYVLALVTTSKKDSSPFRKHPMI